MFRYLASFVYSSADDQSLTLKRAFTLIYRQKTYTVATNSELVILRLLEDARKILVYDLESIDGDHITRSLDNEWKEIVLSKNFDRTYSSVRFRANRLDKRQSQMTSRLCDAVARNTDHVEIVTGCALSSLTICALLYIYDGAAQCSRFVLAFELGDEDVTLHANKLTPNVDVRRIIIRAIAMRWTSCRR